MCGVCRNPRDRPKAGDLLSHPFLAQGEQRITALPVRSIAVASRSGANVGIMPALV